MAKEIHFEQILRAKLGEMDKNQSPLPPKEGPMSYEFNHSVPFFNSSFAWAPKTISKVYKKKPLRNAPPKVEVKVVVTPPEKKETYFSIESWSETEKQTFKGFVILGAQLKENQFTSLEIKREYRRLAKKLHPDLSSSETSSRQFQSLKATYEKLCKKIKSLEIHPV